MNSLSTTAAQVISSKMRISDPTVDMVCDEYVIVKNLLPLGGAAVLELGCGKGRKHARSHITVR